MAFLTSDSLQETYLHHFCLCKHLLLYFCLSTENSKTSWMEKCKQVGLETLLIVFQLEAFFSLLLYEDKDMKIVFIRLDLPLENPLFF